MMKKIDIKNMRFGIRGLGRVNDNCPIDLREYAYPFSDERNAVPVMLLPQKISVSKKIGKTIYDVTADFDIDGKRSLLQQFKSMILENGASQI